MAKKHVRLAKLLFETIPTTEGGMTAETFAVHVREYKTKAEQLIGKRGAGEIVGDVLGKVFRLRHSIKRLRATGMPPGNDLLMAAEAMEGDWDLEWLLPELFGKETPRVGEGEYSHGLSMKLFSEPPQRLPEITHYVGKTLH